MDQSQLFSREEIRRQAASWVIRLADPSACAADRDRFEEWRSRSPHHELAFERERASWEMLDVLGQQPLPTMSRPPVRVKATTGMASRWAAAGAAVLLCAGLWWGGMSAPAYATAVGERRVVALADGSRVELNTDSKIRVRYGADRREVELVRGEALFVVAADRRPFVVAANDTQVVATSSELNVRLRGSSTSVTVAEGQVQVTSAQAATSDNVTATALRQGQEGWYSPQGASSHSVSQEEIRRLLAWQQDAIVLDGQSLVQVTEEFNRYNRRQVVAADPSIASLRLAGYFSNRDVDGFVKSVTQTFPVKAVQAEDGSIHLVRKE